MQGRNSSSSRPLMTPESHDSEFEDNSNATPDSTQPQERVITDTPPRFYPRAQHAVDFDTSEIEEDDWLVRLPGFSEATKFFPVHGPSDFIKYHGIREWLQLTKRMSAQVLNATLNWLACSFTNLNEYAISKSELAAFMQLLITQDYEMLMHIENIFSIFMPPSDPKILADGFLVAVWVQRVKNDIELGKIHVINKNAVDAVIKPTRFKNAGNSDLKALAEDFCCERDVQIAALCDEYYAREMLYCRLKLLEKVSQRFKNCISHAAPFLSTGVAAAFKKMVVEVPRRAILPLRPEWWQILQKLQAPEASKLVQWLNSTANEPNIARQLIAMFIENRIGAASDKNSRFFSDVLKSLYDEIITQHYEPLTQTHFVIQLLGAQEVPGPEPKEAIIKRFFKNVCQYVRVGNVIATCLKAASYNVDGDEEGSFIRFIQECFESSPENRHVLAQFPREPQHCNFEANFEKSVYLARLANSDSVITERTWLDLFIKHHIAEVPIKARLVATLNRLDAQMQERLLLDFFTKHSPARSWTSTIIAKWLPQKPNSEIVAFERTNIVARLLQILKQGETHGEEVQALYDIIAAQLEVHPNGTSGTTLSKLKRQFQSVCHITTPAAWQQLLTELQDMPPALALESQRLGPEVVPSSGVH